ncbi:MAG: hypothetical protein LBQ89_08095 [Treponema sp.]|jgi:hypothetical protein|nr:hypothetical protein [Treponema sp.]
MGQRQLKQYKKTLRKTAQEEKNKIVSDYITRNWDQVLVSSVAMIRRFNFSNRFKIAMTIIFKPDKKNMIKPKTNASPPPQKPASVTA